MKGNKGILKCLKTIYYITFVIFVPKKKKGCIFMAEYVITDGSRFIFRNHSGKYVPVKSEVMADVFNRKQAERIFNNCLPKALKTTFHVEKYDKPLENVKQVTEKELERNTEKIMVSANIQKWLDRISDLNGLVKEAKIRKEQLMNQLHRFEDELMDIDHYIEFSNLNAAQGYKASKEIKECRMKRRSVKNELLVLDIILEQRTNEIIYEEIQKRIQGLDRRTYKSRVRKDLFDL